MAELETPVIDIAYKRGDSKPLIFVLKDSAGVAVDISAYTSPVLSVHDDAAPTDVTSEQFKVTGTFPGGGTDGKVSFVPLITDTDLTPNTYFYDAQILDASGNKITFVEGAFAISQDRAKD
jgi:hypothetical protein